MDDKQEEDYMSDTFIQNDTKPGLMPKVFLERHKRKETAKRKSSLNTKKPTKLVEAEKRNEKLDTALDETNKGFAMLSKMGFKKGMGLGKEGQGISEPIPLEIKAGRKGLGKESQDEQRKQKRQQAYVVMAKRKRVVEENLKGDFKNRMKDKINERQNSSDFFKSQKACEQLDSRKGIEVAKNPWFWPLVANPEEDEDEQGTEEIPDGFETICWKLESITEYLRNEHFYCIWCGTAFDDTNDLSESCPGNTFRLHDE